MSSTDASSSTPSTVRERGPKRPAVAVGDLEGVAAAVRRRRAEQALGAALREPAGPQAHQRGVVRTVATDELGRARIAFAIRSGVRVNNVACAVSGNA